MARDSTIAADKQGPGNRFSAWLPRQRIKRTAGWSCLYKSGSQRTQYATKVTTVDNDTKSFNVSNFSRQPQGCYLFTSAVMAPDMFQRQHVQI